MGVGVVAIPKHSDNRDLGGSKYPPQNPKPKGGRVMPGSSELSYGAKIAHSVLQFAAYSGQCDEMRPSEIRALLLPIFGDKIIKEVIDFYKSA